MINSKGKRLMPIYLIKFLLSIYDGPEVPNFGARMVSRSFIAYVDSLYKLAGGENPTDYGRRLVPEYLIKWIEDADYIEFIDDDIAYIKDVPEKALNFAVIYKLGGMCYKVNQLSDRKNITSSIIAPYSIAFSFANFYFKHTYLFSFNNSVIFEYIGLNCYIPGEGNVRGIHIDYSDNMQFIYNPNYEGTGNFHGYCHSDTNISLTMSNFMIFDLTEMFGEGNEPSTLEEAKSALLRRGIDIDQYNEYNAGSIREIAVTSIISKDSNNNIIDTYSIPDEVKALEGYGYGLDDTIYNAIDFDSKTFIKLVAKRDYQEGDESDPDVMTDMTYTYYPLENPVITDISQYLGDNVIKVEPEGTLIFENENKAYVPSIVSFIVPNGE